MSEVLAGTLRRVDAVSLGARTTVDALTGAETLVVDAPERLAVGDALLDETQVVIVAVDAGGVVTIDTPLTEDLEAGVPLAMTNAAVHHWGVVELDEDPDGEPLDAMLTEAVLNRVQRDADLDLRVEVQWRASPAYHGYWVTAPLDRDAHADGLTIPISVAGDDGEESLGGVNPEGDVHGRDIDVTGELRIALASLVADGQPLDELLDSFGKGVWGWGERTPAVTGIGTTGYAVLHIPLYLPEARRVSLEWSTRLSISASNARFNVVVRYSYDPDTEPAEAVGTSPILALWKRATVIAANNADNYTDDTPVTLAAGYYSLRLELLTFGTDTLNTSGTTLLTVLDRGPANAGENQATKPSAPGTLTAGGTDAGATPAAETRTTIYVYNSTWSRSYRGNGDQIASDLNMYVGDSGNGHGNRSTAIGFNDAKIRADLAGASAVPKVELYLYLSSSPGAPDGSAAIGYHGDSNPSGSYGGVGGKDPDQQRAHNWYAGSGRWVDVTDVGSLTDWLDGTRRGVLLTGPNSQMVWAFAAHGPAQPRNTPTLRFTVER